MNPSSEVGKQMTVAKLTIHTIYASVFPSVKWGRCNGAHLLELLSVSCSAQGSEPGEAASVPVPTHLTLKNKAVQGRQRPLVAKTRNRLALVLCLPHLTPHESPDFPEGCPGNPLTQTGILPNTCLLRCAPSLSS